MSADEQWPIPVEIQQPTLPHEPPKDDPLDCRASSNSKYRGTSRAKRGRRPVVPIYSDSKVNIPYIYDHPASSTAREESHANTSIRQPSEAPIAIGTDHWV